MPSGFDDLTEVVLGEPTEGLLDALCIGEKDGDIAITAGGMVGGDGVSRYFAATGDHFLNGVATARTDVESITGSALFEIAQRHDVGFGKVGDMDVITNAGAIGSWIIVAKNRDRGALAEGDL